MKKLATLMLAAVLLVPFTFGMAQDSSSTAPKDKKAASSTKTKKAKKGKKADKKSDAESGSGK